VSLESLYRANSHRVSGIPAFELVPQQYLPHLGKPFADGVLWEDFTREVDRENAHLASQIDPRRPIFNNEERRGWSAFTVPDSEIVRDTLSALCSAITVPSRPSHSVLDIFRSMVDRLARWYTLPRAGVEEKNADFAFYRLRCVLAGAGYSNWKFLSGLVLSQVGECPYRPDETEEEWNELLIEAHRTSGWPSTLLWLDWSNVPDFEGEAPDWMRALALAHFLKHVRRAEDHLHMVYHGNIEFSPLQTKRQQRSIGTPLFWQNYSRVLAKPSGKDSAKGSALQWAAAILGPDDLLPALPVSDLPGNILAGPWSSLLPAYVPTLSAFLCPGTRLAGVWRAADGHVTPFDGDEEDCLEVAWNTATANAEQFSHARSMFAAALPKTYPVIRPSELIRKVFPHWLLPDPVQQPEDFAGYCALVDAVFCASALRHGPGARADLQREFPLVVVLPVHASAEQSTNQGKGLLCQAIAGAFAPGIPLMSAPDSSSAPDSRAVADELRQWGTLALDEFQIPSAKAHVLSRDNLQTLCTAGQVASGRAMENAGKVSLRHSLVINAKWLDLSDDLRNRSVALFLGELPEEQRARIDLKEMLESGQFAMLLRLAAVSLVEACGLRELGRPSGKTNRRAWRFTTHRMLAVHLFRTTHVGSTLSEGHAYDIIDSVRSDIDDDLARHQQYADETGLSASTSAGINIRLSWASFWAGMDDSGLSAIAVNISLNGESRMADCKTVSVSTLCRMRMEAMNMQSVGFARMLPALTGQEARVSNTAIVRALSSSMRAFYLDAINSSVGGKGAFLPLPGEAGHKWEAFVGPRATSEDPSARTLVVGIRLRDTKEQK
jgi:hypothetical protein